MIFVTVLTFDPMAELEGGHGSEAEDPECSVRRWTGCDGAVKQSSSCTEDRDRHRPADPALGQPGPETGGLLQSGQTHSPSHLQQDF